MRSRVMSLLGRKRPDEPGSAIRCDGDVSRRVASPSASTTRSLPPEHSVFAPMSARCDRRAVRMAGAPGIVDGSRMRDPRGIVLG